MLTAFRWLSLPVLIVGILVGTWTANLWGQTGTFTWNAPQLQNLTQWGTTSVTAAAALSDALGNPTAPSVASHPLVWTGAVWQRRISAALANFPTAVTTTSRNATGVAVAEKSSRWAIYHNPAAGSQATISIAAEAAVRHVADCISFSAAATTNPSATALTINLRDGATGAGTIIQSWQVVVTAATGTLVQPFGLCGLNTPGTTNTAMTLEFSASLANLIQSVSLTGYNVN